MELLSHSSCSPAYRRENMAPNIVIYKLLLPMELVLGRSLALNV